MRKITFHLLLFVLLLLLNGACDSNRVFEAYSKIPQVGWHKDSLVVFTIPVTDTLQNNNLYINIRNNMKYRYSNLWLFVTINQPGEIAVTDTFELLLAEPSGRWLGEGFGGIKTRQVIYKSGVFFPVSGEYEIAIGHGMRDELLKGITDVGFRIEKIN